MLDSVCKVALARAPQALVLKPKNQIFPGAAKRPIPRLNLKVITPRLHTLGHRPVIKSLPAFRGNRSRHHNGQYVRDRWRRLDLGFYRRSDNVLQARGTLQTLCNNCPEQRLVITERLVAVDVRIPQLDQDRADVLMLSFD